ncbi:hypothetical protein AB0E99_22800 [Streptomyces sp. NPDC030592]|uniref:hypothetical protein n=1 Tax=unclassified Streptomyces TaxID=2593676 RepID=UPI0034061787
MADELEEVQRLVETIEAFEAIEDDEACAVAVSQALAQWPAHHSRLRELRQRRVQALKEQGKTWAEIGQLLGGVTPARAQQIGAGLSGASRKKREQADG